MTQRFFVLGLSTFLALTFGFVPRVSAQVDARKKFEEELKQEMERFQKEIERLQNEVAPLEIRQQARGIAGSNLRWGGLHVKKVDAALAEKLGLPENEGMLVTAVDFGSPADKAGLKADDVIVRLGDKAASGDPHAFAEQINNRKPEAKLDVAVVRDGMEQTLKGVAMPQTVQETPLPGRRGPRFGNGFGNGFVPRGKFPRIQIVPFDDGNFPQFRMESNLNGARIRRSRSGDEFAGTYEKDDLRIRIHGKMEKGQAKVSEITIQEGKDTKKFTKVSEAPAQHRGVIQRLLPSEAIQFVPFPRDFPGLPVIPGIDNNK